MRALLILGLSGGALLSPAGVGPGLSVTVRPTTLDVHGDTVRIAYAVRNEVTSTKKLFIFTVNAPAPAIEVERPSTVPSREMLTTTDFGGSVASWSFLIPYVPGRTSPPIAFSAVGLPGLVKYWAIPFIAPDDEQSADVPMADDAPEGPGLSASDSGTTVGIVPFPEDRSRAALLGRLGRLVTQTCTRGWVDNAGVCNSLQVKVRSGAMDALLNELDAQRGKHVNETAYFLLSGNVRALPAR